MSQTSMTENMTIAKAGQIADNGERYVKGYVNNDSVALEAGLGVILDPAATTRDDLILAALGSTNGYFAGVIVREQSDLSADATETAIAVDEPCSVMQMGQIYVEVEDAVKALAPAFIRIVATGTEKLGAWRSDVDTADAVQIVGARFLTHAAAGGLAVLQLLPTYQAVL